MCLGACSATAASDTAAIDVSIETTAIDLSVTASAQQLTAGTGETITFTATAGNAADGTEINWISTYGEIVGEETITNGQATALLHSADLPGDGTVYVSAAGEKKIFDVEHIGNGGVYGKLSQAAIVGDEVTDGSIVIDHWQDQGTYDYVTSTNLELHGDAGSTLRVALGTPLSPNAEPITFFPLQAENEGMIEDADGLHYGMVFGDVSTDHERNALLFGERSYLLVNDADDLHIDDNIFVSVDFEAADFDTSSWPKIGTDLKQGPTLVRQGESDTRAYRLGLVEYQGQVKVEAVIQTTDGSFNVVHTLPIQAEQVYGAALRYKDGMLELEVDDYGLAASTIERVNANGKLLHIEEQTVIGTDFIGYLRSLRIGVESEERFLSKLANGKGQQDVILDASGQSSVAIASTGRMSRVGQIVGMTYATLGTTAQYSPQPIRFANNRNRLQWFNDFLGVKEAHAGWLDWATNTRTRDGVTLISKECAGWITSFVDKVGKVANESKDLVKKAGEIAAMVVGLDDFIVLTKAITALAAGAQDEVDVVEVSFAAVGATLTIVEIVSVGSLSPAVQPLKWGLKGFKTAVKSMGPEGVKAAFGMAKGLGKVISDMIKSRGAKGAAFDMLKHTALALTHLSTSVGKPIFKTFVGVVRSPLDFYNWINMFKHYNKAGGCIAEFAPDNSGGLIYYASNQRGNIKGATAICSSVLAFWVGTAHAANTCELSFEKHIDIIKTIVGEGGDAATAHKAIRDYNDLGDELADLGEYLGDEIGKEINVAFSDEAVRGIAVLLRANRTNKQIRNTIRFIVRHPDLYPAAKPHRINEFLSMIGELEKYHSSAKISGRVFGDLARVYKDSKALDGWNTNYIKGVYHQLDFLKDLRVANITVESLEKGISLDKILRYVDIIADGRRFELKNFDHYFGGNLDAVVDGLEKEINHALASGVNDIEVKDYLARTHFVFRGNPAGAEKMIEAMERKGLDLLDADDLPEAHALFVQQIAIARDVVKNGYTKKVPDVGELMVFQGKNIPL